MIAGQLALVVATLFSGAAVYVLVVEHVARQQLDDRAALTEWKPSYKRGAAMQAPLALIGFVLGTVARWQTSNPWFLAGALALLAPWPWTLLAIKRTNDKLLQKNDRLTDRRPITHSVLQKPNQRTSTDSPIQTLVTQLLHPIALSQGRLAIHNRGRPR
jgi:hypothetical protein